MDDLIVDAQADKGRPYKMYAAIVSAFLTSFVTTNASDLPSWAVGLITATVAAIAVYVIPNPINVKKSRVLREEDPTLFD